MIKLKKNKSNDKIKNNNKKNQKKTFKNIGKTFALSAIFVFSADFSISHYLDNKVNSVVSKEQREEFKNITDYKNREVFLNKRLNYNYYTPEKYKNDLKIVENFNEELKKELHLLYQQNSYMKKNLPEYENFDKFFSEYSKYDYAYYFKFYYLYKKDMNKDKNYNYQLSKNNDFYYINRFFGQKIIDYKLSKNEQNIDYDNLDRDIFNYKEKSDEDKNKLYSKDVLFDIRNGDKSLLERLIIQNELPSYQLSVIYNNIIYNEKLKYKYQKGNEKLFTQESVKNELNYNKKSIVMKNVIDNSIDVFFGKKSLTFNSSNIKNTLMILNAQSEYENNMLKIIKIKDENKHEFNGINYQFYNIINSFNLSISNLLKSNSVDYEKENISSLNSYKKSDTKINYFLSGINNNKNNNDLKSSSEHLQVEVKGSDYKY